METQEHTSVPSVPDVLEVRTPSDLFAAGMLESVSLAREGAAVRYRVVDLEREHQMNPLKRWENTALYEYTLPE